MSRPPSVSVPSSGIKRPMRMRSVVVLPHPDGPRMERNSPSNTSKSSACSTSLPSKRFTRPRADSFFGAPPAAGAFDSFVISTSIFPAASSSRRGR